MFGNVYENKKVLITGNTGFKGSWLTVWLLKLNALIYGISKDIPTEPSMFTILNINSKITQFFEDIRNVDKMCRIIESIKPDFVFHLAAQPIVRQAYKDPIETLSTNIMGTANMLEALRLSNHTCTAIMITSDKCYDNVEWTWGYRESDFLGGKDPYSASKGSAELVIKTYVNSFFKTEGSKIRVISTRAGNVIGGGDWANDRIVPDCIKAWNKNNSVEVRSPNATRPWQHVLEPLSGYLRTGQILSTNKNLNGESYNFGPNADQNYTVIELIKMMTNHWVFDTETPPFSITPNASAGESNLLKLCIDKALHQLFWKPTLSVEETIKYTVKWYYSFYRLKNDMFAYTQNDIAEYCQTAITKGNAWTK